jgi:hypothetical protein
MLARRNGGHTFWLMGGILVINCVICSVWCAFLMHSSVEWS